MGRSARERNTVIAAFTVFALTVAACTSTSDGGTETTEPAPTTSVVPARSTDDQLTIGLLLPVTDPLIGQGLVTAARTAVERINDAGGVLDREIRLEVEDEGATEDTAATGIAKLLANGVDAIVGPSSSIITLGTLDDLVAAGVVTCSPTASALGLDDFPDDRLFFRTVPSDSLQAIAIADVAERTGVQNIAIVYVDDAYGRPFAQAVEDALEEGSRSINVVKSFGFARMEGLDDLADEVVESDARVVIVLAGADDGTAFLGALSSTNFGSLTDVIVNDALRNPTTAQLIETLDPALREIVRGVAPQAQSNDPQKPFDPPGLFAANAFDCVNLIALAVQQVRTDDPEQFKLQIPSLTTGGRTCTAFEPCAELLAENLNINYNGPDGITELLLIGDPARAWFVVYRFDDTGRSVFDRSIVASSL